MGRFASKSEEKSTNPFVRIRERRPWRGVIATDRRIDRSRGREFVKLRNRQYARRHLHYSPFFGGERAGWWNSKLQIGNSPDTIIPLSANSSGKRTSHPPVWLITPATRLVVAYHPPGARAYTYNRNFPNKSLSPRVTSAIGVEPFKSTSWLFISVIPYTGSSSFGFHVFFLFLFVARDISMINPPLSIRTIFS